jgi:hypothetical protein
MTFFAFWKSFCMLEQLEIPAQFGDDDIHCSDEIWALLRVEFQIVREGMNGILKQHLMAVTLLPFFMTLQRWTFIVLRRMLCVYLFADKHSFNWCEERITREGNSLKKWDKLLNLRWKGEKSTLREINLGIGINF